MTDDELINLIRNGNKQLMTELYNRYSGIVYGKCLSLVKNTNSAQDLAHDVMIKVFTNLDKFKGKSDFSYWVHAITYNHCMSFLRKKNKFSSQELIQEELVIASDEEETLNAKFLRDLQLDMLEKVLDNTRAEDKLLLNMYYQDGLSIKQMSRILELKESTVKMRLMRSRNRLAKQLNRLQNGE